jgi:ubiquinone/menaquinone biosynthesis C-methylase UbiE
MEQPFLESFNNWHNQLSVDVDIKTQWHKFVTKEIEQIDLTGKKILEIGCGRGGFACWMAKKYGDKYAKYVAADFSDVSVAIGKSYALQSNILNIDWIVMDIMNMSFPANYFDLVISLETIEHITHPKVGLKELFRVTKPGGVLFLTTPNYGNFYGLYRIYLRLTGRKWTEVGQPINNFVVFDLTRLWLKSVGFLEKTCGTTDISYPSPFLKRDVKLNWKWPNWIIKRLGINSYFIAKKP